MYARAVHNTPHTHRQYKSAPSPFTVLSHRRISWKSKTNKIHLKSSQLFWHVYVLERWEGCSPDFQASVFGIRYGGKFPHLFHASQSRFPLYSSCNLNVQYLFILCAYEVDTAKWIEKEREWDTGQSGADPLETARCVFTMQNLKTCKSSTLKCER